MLTNETILISFTFLESPDTMKQLESELRATPNVEMTDKLENEVEEDDDIDDDISCDSFYSGESIELTDTFNPFLNKKPSKIENNHHIFDVINN